MRNVIARLAAVVACLAGTCAPALRAQTSPGDSLRPYHLEGVVVRATRTRSPADRVPLRTSVLTASMIGEGNGGTLGDALRSIPGLVVREYGGGGGIQTLSLRGMGSEATLVLVDGVPANNLQTGVIDLRMLPIGDAGAVEIVRGGMSSLYGSSAMAGMINVRTDRPATGSYVRLGGSAGSFGATSFSASARVRAAGAMLTAGAGRERGSGRYPVRSEINGSLLEGLRSNSDFLSEHLFIRADWEAQGSLALSAVRFDRGSPGPLVAMASQGDGRESDDALMLSGSYSGSVGPRLELSVTGHLQRADEHYLDATGVFRGDDNYRNLAAGVSPVLHFAPGGRWTVTSGWDAAAANASGSALAGTARRTHVAWFAAAEVRSDTLGAGDAVLSLVPALRWEAFSSSRPSWNPQVGATGKVRSGDWILQAHASVGRSYRVPTMNELYYAGAGGFGNPSLLPEVAFNAEAGVTAETELAGTATCDLTAYTMTTRDRIVWEPATSPLVWSPANIARTVSRGFEAEARWEDRSRTVAMQGSYVFIDARNAAGSPEANPAYDKQLPYVPLETAAFSVQLRLPVSRGACRRLLFRLEDVYTGERYLTDDNASAIPGTHVLGGNVGIVLDLLGDDVLLKYEIDNITDRDVQGMPGYPMPLRHHAVTFSLEHRFGKEP